MHLVLRPVGLPLLPLDLGPERDGSVSGRSSGARECASASSAPLGAGKGEVARPQRTPPARTASSVASPRSSQHALRRGESGESSVVRSRSRSSRVSRSSDRGTRKDRRAHSRSASSCDRSRRSRSCSVESAGGGPRLGRCPPASGHGVTGRSLRTAPGHVAFTLALGETGHDPRIDTGLAETAFDVTGSGLRTATGRVDSVCVPLLAGEVAVTV